MNFDGINSHLTRGGQLTGAANSRFGMISLWFNMQGGDGIAQSFFSGAETSDNFELTRLATGKIRAVFFDTASATLRVFDSPGSYTTTSNPGWHSLIISLSMESTPTQFSAMVIDDVIVTSPGGALANIKWLQGTPPAADFGVGAIPNLGTQKLNADLAEVYLNQVLALDMSIVANRRKFVTAANKPVDLGAAGEIPTGASPILFLSGATATWEVNKGTGGGFTEVGALTTATTSPSD